MTRFATIRRMLAIMLLALWWGGFNFYAGRVVFIGHEVLRSKVRQRFITERVTTELNWPGIVMLAVVGWELFASAPFSRRVDCLGGEFTRNPRAVHSARQARRDA